MRVWCSGNTLSSNLRNVGSIPTTLAKTPDVGENLKGKLMEKVQVVCEDCGHKPTREEVEDCEFCNECETMFSIPDNFWSD